MNPDDETAKQTDGEAADTLEDDLSDESKDGVNPDDETAEQADGEAADTLEDDLSDEDLRMT